MFQWYNSAMLQWFNGEMVQSGNGVQFLLNNLNVACLKPCQLTNNFQGFESFNREACVAIPIY